MRRVGMVIGCLIMAGCASTSKVDVGVDGHGCSPGPPPQLAIIHKVRDGDAATAWKLDMHGTGINLVTESSSGKPMLVLEKGSNPGDVRATNALGAQLLCIADPSDDAMYSVRGLTDEQIHHLLKGFGAGHILHFKVMKDGVVHNESINRLGYSVEG